jgi:2-methylcitrate dehydratase PrpD
MPVTVDAHVGGQVFTSRCDVPTGHPSRPLGWEGVEAKVRDCARTGAGATDDEAVDQVVATVRDVEHVSNPGRLMALLSRARTIRVDVGS